jgi:hypothetical protein
MEGREKPMFPWFIHYSTHAETLDFYYKALGVDVEMKATPGSAFFIEFFLRNGKDRRVRFVFKKSAEA